MDARLAELLHLLELERLERDLFRGASRDIGAPQVFGGQVLGQALRAAYATVPASHAAHSLHAYFLKRGDFDAPIVYFVDRSRDGHSFANRRVTAIQHGEQIFHMAASFQLPEEGLTHQLPMPEVPAPEALSDGALPSRAELTVMPEKLREYYRSERPFEFRLIPTPDADGAGLQRVWVRTVDRLPDDDALHRCLLAYASDFHLLRTATLPHVAAFLAGRRFMASIDHAMWFHWPVRVDEWFLYATDSPSASGARGFARGSIFSRDGRLLASTAQEGLMRAAG
ncbi:MAG TPA: acyl-CoA thioesterase II [Steroidobacteraceae bacterium]|jgi:acyl-CoA thioesterase-2|nr:acyl-CoA thioesterase II [Steroidobacteraceae bacterium]